MTVEIAVAIEAAPRRTFVTAVDWPGLSRSGKTEEAALEALDAGDVGWHVAERAVGDSGTEFGVPSRITDADRRPVDADTARLLVSIIDAAWTTFDEVAAAAPAELRKGPRGGGRDRDRVVAHVVESDHAYAREIGTRLRPPAPDDLAAIRAMRTAVLDVLAVPSDGSPLAGRRWPPRYAAQRIAWHALDHAWEIEDRSKPTS